mmetsp:Transcript_9643/g.30666  ORF Transcript_9643/g.30666 Transcript_9643/m.30666 type:complete len:201 (-) Transcript_9643:676-1278(-)
MGRHDQGRKGLQCQGRLREARCRCRQARRALGPGKEGQETDQIRWWLLLRGHRAWGREDLRLQRIFYGNALQVCQPGCVYLLLRCGVGLLVACLGRLPWEGPRPDGPGGCAGRLTEGAHRVQVGGPWAEGTLQHRRQRCACFSLTIRGPRRAHELAWLPRGAGPVWQDLAQGWSFAERHQGVVCGPSGDLWCAANPEVNL